MNPPPFERRFHPKLILEHYSGPLTFQPAKPGGGVDGV
jgi:hypothetical protein